MSGAPPLVKVTTIRIGLFGKPAAPDCAKAPGAAASTAAAAAEVRMRTIERVIAGLRSAPIIRRDPGPAATGFPSRSGARCAARLGELAAPHFALAREHPARILRGQAAHLVEPLQLVGTERDRRGADVVGELLGLLRADDHARHLRLVE